MVQACVCCLQKMWNKVHASVIKRASHGFRRWIKAVMVDDVGVVSLLQQRKTSLLSAYIQILRHFSLPILFCASNSWPAFSFFSLSAEWLPRATVSGSDKNSVYYVWNMDIYLTRVHGFPTAGLYSPPEAVWGTFNYRCTHFISRLLNC